MPEQIQGQDQLSSEDLAALHETYTQLRAANDPRADKVRQFIVAQGNSILHPEDTRSALRKGWDWLNKGLISKDTFVRAISGYTPEKLNEALAPPEGQSESPAHAAIREFVRGSIQDTGETASAFTSPLSAGTMAAGPIAKAPGVIGKVARVASTGAALGFGAQGAKEVIQNAPKALEGDPEAARAALTGASMAAFGAEAAGRTVAPRVMEAPISQAPREALETARQAKQTLITNPTQAVTKAVKGAWDPSQASPEQAATMAFRPRNSKYNWQQEIQTALPDMRRAADSSGLDVNKITLQDAHNMAGQAKRQVWDEYTQNFRDPAAAAQVETSKVADTIRSTVTPRMREQNPNLAERIENIADTYQGRNLSVQDIEGRVQELNNETRAIEARHPADKWAAQSDPNNAYVFAERNALRNLLISKLDEVSGPGGQELRNRYGALSSVEDVIQRRIPVAERQAPESLHKILAKAYAAGKIVKGALSLNPLDVAEGAVTLASQKRSARLNDPDYLTQQAFKNTQASPPAAIQGEYLPNEGDYSAVPPRFAQPQLPPSTRERGVPENPVVDEVTNREYGASRTPVGTRGDQGVLIRPAGALPPADIRPEEFGPQPPARLPGPGGRPALPPATLPERLAPKAPNSVETVGIPESAEPTAIQRHFETKPQSFNEFLKRGVEARRAKLTETPVERSVEEARPLPPSESQQAQATPKAAQSTPEKAEVTPESQSKNDFLKAGAEARQRPFEARAEQSAESDLPGRSSTVRLMNPKELNTDPKTFQWRQIPRNAIPEDAPWDQAKAGPIDIWNNPADGKWYVIEGHHRYNHAIRKNVPEMEVRVKEFDSPQAARRYGALANIERGNATPFDAALYLRETGITPEEMRRDGINLTGEVAQKGAALSQLSNGLWEEYKSGKLDESKAVAIGTHLSDPSQQQALADLARKQKLNAAEMGALAKRIQDQGNTSQTSMGLFGADEKSVSNAIERERIALKIEKELSTDRTALQSVLRSGQKRSELIKQAGNIVNVDKTSEQAMIAAAVKEGFNRLRNRSGEVADLLDEAGQRRTAGEKSDAIFKELYPKIRAAVLNELGQSAGQNPANPKGAGTGSEGSGGSESGRPETQEEGLDLDRAPTFYSKALQVAEQKLPNYAPGDAILATLKNSGVKPEEMKWIGLDDYLKSKPKLSKQDVSNFIRENQVNVQEVEHGGPKKPLSELWSQYKDGDNNVWTTNIAGRNYSITELRGDGGSEFYAEATRPNTSFKLDEYFKSFDAAQRWIESLRKENQSEGTKFSQYTLPGGENYRELKLTLPDKYERASEAYTKRFNEIAQKYGVTGPELTKRWTPEESAELTKLAREADSTNAQRFKSGHFDESNILAHVRFNDRIDADGKKNLFLEEVQSDWHQKGRDKGYQDSSALKGIDKELADAKAEHNKAYSALGDEVGAGAMGNGTTFWDRTREHDGDYVKIGQIDSAHKLRVADAATPEQRSALERLAAAEQRVNEIRDRQDAAKKGVPDAPFKSSWHELALKKMLRYAAENGYDRLSWTTGEQQAARYDLSKEIKTLNYDPDNQRLVAVLNNGSRHIDKAPIPPKELPDYIGKEAAEKLLNTPKNGAGNHELEGSGLKVGGSGMRGFYDKIIPDFLNKYGKKWGARVGETRITNEAKADFTAARSTYPTERGEWGVFNDRGSLVENFPTQAEAEAKAAALSNPAATEYRIGKSALREWRIESRQPGQDWIRHAGIFDSEAAARDAIENKQGVKVHSIDITPEMKKAVLEEGQPLFREAVGPHGEPDSHLLSLARNLKFGYQEPQGSVPGHVKLNDYANQLVQIASGRRFVGTNTSIQGAMRLVGRLDAYAEQLQDKAPAESQKIKQLADTLENATHANDGLTLIGNVGPQAERIRTAHEELTHAAVQRRPGQGDIQKGVPYEKMLSDPSILAEHPDIHTYEPVDQIRAVAESFVDWLNGEHSVKPEQAQKSAETYLGHLADTHGLQPVHDAKAVYDYIDRLAQQFGIVKEGEQFDATATAAGRKAIANVIGARSGKGGAAGRADLQGESGAGQPESVAGRQPEIDLTAGGNGSAEHGGANRESNPDAVDRPAARGTMEWGGGGVSDLEAFVKKGLQKIEPAPDQHTLFGESSKMYRLIRNDAEGIPEKALITEEQLQRLASAFPRVQKLMYYAGIAVPRRAQTVEPETPSEPPAQSSLFRTKNDFLKHGIQKRYGARL